LMDFLFSMNSLGSNRGNIPAYLNEEEFSLSGSELRIAERP